MPLWNDANTSIVSADWNSLLMLQPCLYRHPVLFVDFDDEIDRPATDFAILDILL